MLNFAILKKKAKCYTREILDARRLKLRNLIRYIKRTCGDREGHWGRWLWYVIDTKVFLVSGGLFSETSTQITTSIWGFLVKRQISMIMADFSWGHKNIFRRDTRVLCFSWYTRGLCSQGMQRINKSQFVFVCVTTQSWLWFAVCK